MSLKKPIPSDLKLVIALVLLTNTFILIPFLSNSPIRTALGLPMVLFIPGYALIAALFPAKDDLDGIERVALSFGLSIAVVPLIGLGLNYTPWGIRLIPILVSLSCFTISMALITIYRREALAENAFIVPFQDIYDSARAEIFSKPDSKLDRILSIILVLSILASVITLAYVVVTPKQGEKFTEFYILGPEGMADGYNTELEDGDSVDVIVGIVNHEYEIVDYSLELQLNNKSIEMPEDLRHISLAHNQTWEKPLSFIPTDTGTEMKLQYLLYRQENMTEAYRDLHLWINISESEAYSKFYMQAWNSSQENIDTDISLGETVDILLSIVNHEYRSVDYSLGMNFNGRTLELSENYRNITLEHNGMWSGPISFTPISRGDNMQLEYLLYKENNLSEPHEKIQLNINVTEAEHGN
jgi:uncharacterized membrane protein